MDKISIIIPCYWADDRLVQITRNCINTLDDFPGEIIVVDDGSPIKVVFDDVINVQRPENGGYAHAVNTGFDATSADIIIVSNNDIEFIQPDWLKHLVDPLLNGYDISSIRTTEPDGWDTEDKLEEDARFGSIFAITREALDKVGYFDEKLGRGYYEDVDLYMRAKELGLKIVKNHNGLVHHLGKQTYGTVDPDDKIHVESTHNFVRKWGKLDADSLYDKFH